MPSKVQTMRAQQAARSPAAVTKPSFELPAFAFEDESLVAGTNLPAPVRDSPHVLPRADPLGSHPSTPDAASQAAAQGKSLRNGPTSAGRATHEFEDAATDAAGASPGMKRPHHVRRLLSLRNISQTFANHGRADSSVSGAADSTISSDFGPPKRSRTPSIFGRSSTSTWGARPESRSGGSIFGGGGNNNDASTDGKDSRKKLRKRMSSGFWNRRGSMTINRVLEDNIPENGEAHIRPRTPPPQLPEITSLKIGQELKEDSGGFLNSEDMFKGIHYKPEV